MVNRLIPDQVTLVPYEENALTSNTGWDTIKHRDFLKEVINEFKGNGIRTSIFIDPNEKMIEGAKVTGTDRIELYTEAYAINYLANKEKAIESYLLAAQNATKLGLEINAGHDLNLKNLHYLVEMGNINEVSIGHAIVIDALHYGFEETILKYLNIIRN